MNRSICTPGAANIRSRAESKMLLCISHGGYVGLTSKIFNTRQPQKEYPLKTSATYKILSYSKKKEDNNRATLLSGNQRKRFRQRRRTTDEKRKKNTRRGGNGKNNKAPWPKAPEAGNQRKQETTEAHKGSKATKRRKKRKTKTGKQRSRKGATPATRGPEKQKDKAAEKMVRRTITHPGGRPARPGQEGQANAHTHGTRAWCPPTRKGRCRRPLETAPVHQPSPPSNNGRHWKSDTSVTGSAHANHRSARSQRPTPEGPARDNPIAGPRMNTTPSGPSAPALAGASGRNNEPGSRPASACPSQQPSKAGGTSLRGRQRHHGIGKADQSTESDQTGRGVARHAGPRGTPETHAAGHKQGTRTGAKQQRPPGAANSESAHNTQRTAAREQVPSNTSRFPNGRVRARRVPSSCRLRTAAVQTDECAPSSVTSSCRLQNSRRPDGRVRAQRVRSPCWLRTAAVRIH